MLAEDADDDGDDDGEEENDDDDVVRSDFLNIARGSSRFVDLYDIKPRPQHSVYLYSCSSSLSFAAYIHFSIVTL